jgi:hypothetical protein
MSSEEYRRRIEEAFQGEVAGEALFEGLAGKLDNAEDRYKMSVLAQLERETKELVRPLVAKLGGDTRESAEARAKGISQAQVLATMPRAKFMHIFRREVAKFVAAFQELERSGRTEDSQILAGLTAHEQALHAFSESECSDDSADSLAPVTRLLKHVPSRTE